MMHAGHYPKVQVNGLPVWKATLVLGDRTGQARRPKHRVSAGLSAAAILVAWIVTPASAAPTLPLGFTDASVASVAAPTGLAGTPDGRILVTEQGGRLRVIKNGALLATPALDLSAVVCSNSERGLESVEVDPSFSTNHFIYLYYTYKKTGSCPTQNTAGPMNRVSRFVLPATDVVNPTSQVVLIDNMLSYNGNHNGGDLHFGKDGFLYASVGDGGCDYAGNSGCGGQNDASRDKNVLLGKVLRITRDGDIPAGNPFIGAFSTRCNTGPAQLSSMNCKETYARGLRNPFRLAFDPNVAGTSFYINDVGQNTWEEIDLGKAGADYGWNTREGHCATDSTTNCGAPPAGMTNPILDYPHTGGCNAITDGAFVPNGSGWPPSYTGKYLFADYVCGSVFRLDPQGASFVRTPVFTGLGSGGPIDMAFLPFGSSVALYYTTYVGGGEVRRIAFTSDGTPVASISANPTSGLAPLTVNFDGSASADPNEDPLTYHWTFGDGGTSTTASPTTSYTYTVNATRTASLTVEDPAGHISAPSSIVITVGNHPPVASISSPAAGSTFSVGQSILLSGSATDAEEGTLANSRLSWRVLLHHASHTHPYFGPTTGNNLTITGPAPEDLAAASNSYLEIYLTATDSLGLSSTVQMNLQPHKVPLTFTTKPTGRQVIVQGVTFVAPVTVTSWENWSITIKAPSKDGYVFLSWSDGGAKEHVIVTPAAPATYTARFVKVT